MKLRLACFASAMGAALAGCAIEPGGPSPYGYAAAPYDAPGSAYWSSPYYAPYAPYGYAGSTLGLGFGGERWHERDRDWHRNDRDWHGEGAAEGHHRAECSVPRSDATTPSTHAAPARPAPPSASSPKEKPAPSLRGSAF